MKNSESAENKPPLEDEDEVQPEYDFSAAIRGKFAGRIQRDTVMVTLAPDIAAAFPDADSVNDALRLLLKTAKAIQAA